MGEIRFVGTGKTCGYPYLVCKSQNVDKNRKCVQTISFDISVFEINS